jgi:hypothetical protein
MGSQAGNRLSLRDLVAVQVKINGRDEREETDGGSQWGHC